MIWQPWRHVPKVAGVLVLVSGAVTSAVLMASSSDAKPGISASLRIVGGKQAHPKQVVSVAGSHFSPSVEVSISFDGVGLGSAESSTSGSFTDKVTVPKTALPGSHQIGASDAKGDDASAALTVRTNWVHNGFSVGRDGANPYENVLKRSNVSGLTQAWSLQGVGGVAGQASIVNGVSYFCTENSSEGNGSLTAANATTGAFMWHTGGGCDDTPLVVGNDIYSVNSSGSLEEFTTSGVEVWATTTSVGSEVLATDGTNIYTNGPGVVNMTNGDVVWANAGQGHGGYNPTGDPTYSSGTFVVPLGQSVEGVDATNGDVEWTFSTANPADGTPTIVGSTVYVADTGDLYALSLNDGSALWQTAISGIDGGSPVVQGSSIYILSTGGIESLDASDGDVLWSSTVTCCGSRVTYATVANGVLYVAGDTSSVVALNSSTGATLWSTSLVADSPVVANGYLYVNAGPEVAYSISDS